MNMKEYDEKSLLAQMLIANEILREVQLHKDDDDLSIKELVSNLCNEIPGNNVKDIYSPGFLLGQFYFVFVLLGEKRKHLPDKGKPIMELVNIDKEIYKDITVDDFLRHLRNAIAHFRVQINDKYEFIFIDRNPKKNKVTFEITLSLDKMQILYKELLWMLARHLVETD